MQNKFKHYINNVAVKMTTNNNNKNVMFADNTGDYIPLF